MSGHIASTRIYYLVFLALLVGTGLTYWAALIDFGFFNNVVMLAIATGKLAEPRLMNDTPTVAAVNTISERKMV